MGSRRGCGERVECTSGPFVRKPRRVMISSEGGARGDAPLVRCGRASHPGSGARVARRCTATTGTPPSNSRTPVVVVDVQTISRRHGVRAHNANSTRRSPNAAHRTVSVFRLLIRSLPVCLLILTITENTFWHITRSCSRESNTDIGTRRPIGPPSKSRRDRLARAKRT